MDTVSSLNSPPRDLSLPLKPLCCNGPNPSFSQTFKLLHCQAQSTLLALSLTCSERCRDPFSDSRWLLHMILLQNLLPQKAGRYRYPSSQISTPVPWFIQGYCDITHSSGRAKCHTSTLRLPHEFHCIQKDFTGVFLGCTNR